MSEAELHILKSRLQQGMWNKAQRGEVLNHAPIGYVHTVASDFVIDPDEQVQAVVRLIFEQFRRHGSVSGLLRWLVRHDVQVPVRPHFGAHRGELEWRRPSRVTLLNMLHHPIYAGAIAGDIGKSTREEGSGTADHRSDFQLRPPVPRLDS